MRAAGQPEGLALAGALFEACWARPLRPVEAGNQRGHGHSGAGIAQAHAWPELHAPGDFYVKRQQRFYCHPIWNACLPTPTLRRERRALAFAQAHGLPVPRVLAYGEGSGGRALLALAAIAPANELAEALAACGHDRAARAQLLGEVGAVFARMHALRVRHGALYPKHVLVRADARPGERVWLIDFEKARRPLRRATALRDDLEQFLRRAAFLGPDDVACLADAYAAAGLPQARAALLRAR